MTLIVSVKTLEGIVLAADRLITDITPEFEPTEVVGKPNITINRMSGRRAQKVFPFLNRYGIGIWGAGSVVDKTWRATLHECEAELSAEAGNSMMMVANHIAAKVHSAIRTEYERYPGRPPWDGLPNEREYCGFQIVGYINGEPTISRRKIGREILTVPQPGSFPWQLDGDAQGIKTIECIVDNQQLDWFKFTASDGIDLCRAMINFQSEIHRLTKETPTIGGGMQAVIVYPFGECEWVTHPWRLTDAD